EIRPLELTLGEIQLYADTVGVVEKELRIPGPRNDAFAKFDAPRLQALAHALDIGCDKGDMVKPAGVVILLLGTAYHDALSRRARAHPMHGGDPTRVKPVTGKTKRRAIAVLEPEHVAVKFPGALKICGFNRVVLESAKRHVFSSRIN